MSIYYKYAPYGKNIVVLSYVDDYVYWYTYEPLGTFFVYTLRKNIHVNFLGYSHWFMSIKISQMKDDSISVYQARYATSIVSNYLNTTTVKTSANFYKTNFTYDIIFTNDDLYNSDEQV